MNQKFACFYFDEPIETTPIVNELYKYSSHVYLARPHSVLIEYGQSFRLISENNFLKKAQLILDETAKDYRVGLATNLLSSFIQAKHNVNDILQAPLNALLDLLDPQGLEKAFATETSKMLSTLKKLQLNNLNDFNKLPRAHFPSRFGKVGELLKRRIVGEYLPSFERASFAVRFVAQAELTSSYNGALLDIANKIEDILDQKIFPPVRKMGAKIEELKITLHLETNSLHPEPTRVFNVKFVQPQYQAKDTNNIIWTSLEFGLQKQPIDFSTPILKIEVEALRWLFEIDEQESMFNKERLIEERHNSLLSRQRIRYGQENIFSVEILEDWRPEKSWRKHLDLKTKPKQFFNTELLPERLVNSYPVPKRVHISSDRSRITIGERSAKIVDWDPLSEVMASHWYDNKTGEIIESCERTYSRLVLENKKLVDIFEDPNGQFFLQGFSG